MFQDQRADLLKKLNAEQTVAFIEGQSVLASRWMRTIPFTKFQTLTVEDVAAALYAKTLQPGFLPMCKHCHRQNSLGHHEVCEKRTVLRTARHEGVKKALAATIRCIKGTSVRVEPRMDLNKRARSLRTDLQITGPGPSYSAAVVELDVTVVSLFSLPAIAARGCSEIPSQWESEQKVEKGIQIHLAKKAEEKVEKYKGRVQHVFHPFVISAGGYLDLETTKLLDDWRDKLGGYSYNQLLIDMSIGLIRNRAHCSVL
jgi:hypothetical protein